MAKLHAFMLRRAYQLAGRAEVAAVPEEILVHEVVSVTEALIQQCRRKGH